MARRSHPAPEHGFHHALVDGLHIARLVAGIEEEAREPADWFG